MNKTDLIQAVSGAVDMPQKAVERALNATLDTIAETIGSGGTVAIPGFGTFVLRHRDARKGRNPQTGEEVDIPACDVPAFKPGKRLRDAVNT